MIWFIQINEIGFCCQEKNVGLFEEGWILDAGCFI